MSDDHIKPPPGITDQPTSPGRPTCQECGAELSGGKCLACRIRKREPVLVPAAVALAIIGAVILSAVIMFWVVCGVMLR